MLTTISSGLLEMLSGTRLKAGLVGLFEGRKTMTFQVAKSLPDAYIIMEGDYGGQCFLTAPMRIIKCEEKDLRQLLFDLDSIYWDHIQGTVLTFAEHKPGDFIDSGENGGRIQEDLWVHNDLIEMGLEDSVRRVLSGNGSLTSSSSELARLREKFLAQYRARFKHHSS